MTSTHHTRTRLHVDWTRCDGHGACAELLAGVIERDEWGYPRPVTRDRDAVIDREHLALARRAVDACPLMALSLTRD